MNSLLPIETLGGTIRAHVTAGDKSAGKAEEHYKAAGIHLAEAKERIFKTKGVSWPIFLVTHCGLRQTRANELIALADGRVTLEGIRERKRESMRRTREAATESPPRGGESGEKVKEKQRGSNENNEKQQQQQSRASLLASIKTNLDAASLKTLIKINSILKGDSVEH